MPPRPPAEDHLWDAWLESLLRQHHTDIQRLWKRGEQTQREFVGSLPGAVDAFQTTTTCGCAAFSTTIISDLFTDTNGTAITDHTPDTDTEGGGWFDVASVVVPDIQGNKLTLTGATLGQSGSASIDSGVSDGELSVDADFVDDNGDSGSVNLRFRSSSDASPSWLATFNSTFGCRLLKFNSAGSATVVDSGGTITAGNSYALKVEFCCDSIICYIDGVEVINVTDSDHQTETHVGIAIIASNDTTVDVPEADNFLFKSE